MIAHSCGVRHARELERRHVRLVQPAGGSVAFDVLCPLPAATAASDRMSGAYGASSRASTS